jgi:cell division protein FtsB
MLFKYGPFILVLAFGVKLMLTVPAMPDVIAFLGSIALQLVLSYTNRQSEIAALTSRLAALEKDQDDIKTHVGGLKIGQQMRYGSGR